MLERLNISFPNDSFPRRMLERLEREQAHRQLSDDKRQQLEAYVAESDRLATGSEIELQKSEGMRAERVLYVLTAVGVALIFGGYQEAGMIELGTTAVAVVGAFLRRALRGGK